MFREILIVLHYEKSSAKIDTCLEHLKVNNTMHPKVNITMWMTMQKNNYSSFSDGEEWRGQPIDS